MKYYRTDKTHIIGVKGTIKGAGATWLSLMTASYMSDILNKKTCIVELSGGNDLIALADDTEYENQSKKIRIDAIDIYCSACTADIPQVKNRGYDICVLDLGCDINNCDELMRCDTKIITTSIAPWIKSADKIIEEYGKEVEDFSSWRLFINFTLPGIRKHMGRLPVVTGIIPTEPDPFRLSGESIKFFRKMVI